MLAALTFILAAAVGQTGKAAIPFGPNAGFWRFTTPEPPITFSCRLVRKDNSLTGSCLGGGFKSGGVAYGLVDGSEIHVSIYFERLDKSEVSYDFVGVIDDDTIYGTMLTTDGDKGRFEARPGVIPPDAPAPLVQ